MSEVTMSKLVRDPWLRGSLRHATSVNITSWLWYSNIFKHIQIPSLWELDSDDSDSYELAWIAYIAFDLLWGSGLPWISTNSFVQPFFPVPRIWCRICFGSRQVSGARFHQVSSGLHVCFVCFEFVFKRALCALKVFYIRTPALQPSRRDSRVPF